MLDDEEPDDPDVRRLWLVATVADQFHQLPSMVARSLDSDPSRIDLAVIPLLRYNEAKHAFDNSKDSDDLKPWQGNKIMEAVMKNTMELHRERVARRKDGNG